MQSKNTPSRRGPFWSKNVLWQQQQEQADATAEEQARTAAAEKASATAATMASRVRNKHARKAENVQHHEAAA